MSDTYSIFRILSRVIIVFAVITLIAGFIMRFSQNKPKTQSAAIDEKPVSTIPISTSAAELNLNGPFVCNFSSKEASISAFVKDKNVYAQIKESSKASTILLNGDCLYFWKNFSTDGEKICGLSPYLLLIGNMPLGNLLKNNKMLSSFGKLSQSDKIPAIFDTCKKQEIQDGKMFTIPKNILFKEKK